MTVHPNLVEEIFNHLETAQQLSIDLNLEIEHDEKKLDQMVGKLLEAVVKSVVPILQYLEGVEQFKEPGLGLFEPGKFYKGFELEVPIFQMKYRGAKTFNRVILTTEGKLVAVGSGWLGTIPWYFLDLVDTDVMGHINFLIIFLEHLIELLREKLPGLKTRNDIVKQLEDWVSRGRELVEPKASE